MTRINSSSIVNWARCATIVCCLTLLSVSAHAIPSFSKSFSPNTIGPGSTSVLSFTITNDAASTNSMNFGDNLPAGMVIADPANASQSCEATLSAPAGGSSITMTDGRLAANQSCTVRVNVTALAAGTYVNTSGDLTSSEGNSGNATANLVVATDQPGFSKSFSPNAISLGDRSSLTFTIDNTANTSSLSFMSFSDSLPTGVELANPVNATDTCTNGTLTANSGSSLISYTTGTLGAGSSCLISVDVVASGTGTLINTSGDLTSFDQTNTSRNSGFAVAAVDVDVAIVHLTKTFVDDPVAPGGTVELNFEITNRDRSNDATNIAFSDNLDSILTGLAAVGLPASDACGAGSSLGGSGILSLTGGNLAAGASCNFSVTLQVPATAAAGGYSNLTSALTADLGGSSFTGNMASDTLFVDVGPILSKTFLSNPVGAGDTVSIEFTITNSSTTATAANINFVDNISQFIDGALSTGLPVNDVCGLGSVLDTLVITTETFGIQLSGGNLAAGDSCTFTADIILAPGTRGGVHTNVTELITATINGSTSIGNPAEASLTVAEAPELIKLFTDDPVAAGGIATLEFTLFNPETALSDTTDITFSDDLDATLSGLVATGLPISDACGSGSTLSGSSQITLTGGNLLVGESCTFTVSLSVPAATLPGNYLNQTSDVSASVGGVASVGTGGADTLTVAGLDISKSFLQSPVIAGSTVPLEFTITNTSTLDASAITLTDDLGNFIPGTVEAGDLPASDVCGTSSTWSTAGDLLILQGGNLLAGQSCTFSANVVIPAATTDGRYANVTSNLLATLAATVLVLDPASAELEVSSELIGLSKTFANNSVSLGFNTSLDFVVTNLSTSETVIDIAFTDDLDAVLSGLVALGLPVTDLCGTGSSLSGSSILSFSGGSLAPGASCAFSVDLNVPAAAEEVSSITNTTSSSSGLVGNLAVNGAPATANAIVVNVSFSKAFDSPVIAGQTTTLTFTIENNGADTLDRLFFTDDLQAVIAGMTASGLPLADVCGSGSLLTGTSVITLTGGVLAPAESCQFSIDVSIPAATAAGEYQNVTIPLSDEPLDIAPPAVALLQVDVSSATFSKSFDGSIEAGTSGTLTFEIQNTGTVDLTQLAFTDDLDAVLTGLTAIGLPTADVCGVGSTLTGSSLITLADGNLTAGSSCLFSVQVEVPVGTTAGDYTNITSDLSAANEVLTEAASATLAVTDAPDPPSAKVTLCHKPGTRAEKTLIVHKSSVKDHLEHGDSLGACT